MHRALTGFRYVAICLVALAFQARALDLSNVSSFGVSPDTPPRLILSTLSGSGFRFSQEPMRSISHGLRWTFRRGRQRVVVVLSRNQVLGVHATSARIGNKLVVLNHSEAELVKLLGKPWSRHRRRNGGEELQFYDPRHERAIGVTLRDGKVAEIEF